MPSELHISTELYCALVAHHTNALHEARERGLHDALAQEFSSPTDLLLSALTDCDLTTSPDGEP